MGAVYGLLTSLSIGFADLFGRRLARDRGALVTGVYVQATAVVVSIVALGIVDSAFSVTDLALGLVSGLGLGVGLASYFSGLRVASAAVVAPIVAALSAVLPYLYAVARGADPTALGVTGAVLALAGLLVITSDGRADGAVTAGVRWGVLGGLGYGIGLGIVVDASSGSGAWPALAQRISALGLMLAIVTRTGTSLAIGRPLAGAGVTSGVFAGASTVFFLLGLDVDPTSAVVTGSIFPAITVAVGKAVYGDSVSARQIAGMLVVLTGVVLVAVP